MKFRCQECATKWNAQLPYCPKCASPKCTQIEESDLNDEYRSLDYYVTPTQEELNALYEHTQDWLRRYKD